MATWERLPPAKSSLESNGLTGAFQGRISLDYLRENLARVDKAVSQTPSIDRFCSSSAWVIPAFESFHVEGEPWLHALDEGFVLLFRGLLENWGRMLMPLEACWCLGNPLVGPDPLALLAAFQALLLEKKSEWDAILLSGFSTGSEAWLKLVGLSRRFLLYQGPATQRCIASLAGGFEGFLTRRTAKFRNNLRRDRKSAKDAGVHFVRYNQPLDLAECHCLFHLIMDIESRCWKGRSGQGVDEGAMRHFYRRMFHMLAPSGRHRLILAYVDQKAVGYILGGIFEETYRGLQFSFDAELGHSGLGNALQAEMIELLSEEGLLWYDLGTDIPYKRRWGERRFETQTLIMAPR